MIEAIYEVTCEWRNQNSKEAQEGEPETNQVPKEENTAQEANPLESTIMTQYNGSKLQEAVVQ